MIPLWKLSGRLGNQMFQFAYLYSEAMKSNIPDYYLQNEKYFDHGMIKHLYGGGIVPSDYVSIHVRRGDMVTNGFDINLSETDYYARAMAGFPNERFMVFSDDIDWCKQQDLFKDCVFSEGNTEVEDMNKMAGCKHNIIANSSFSWWAAYLNPNPNKRVICPEFEYQDHVERRQRPQSWKRI